MSDTQQSGHGEHDHPSFLQHHFETPEQQADATKFGMWLFLATEILLFGGLFCAYAIYRANHPEVFMYAHQFLDKNLGAINTVVLLVSSLTMAWGVRAAQLNQQKLLKILLTLTLLGGFGFMGIKSVEYKSKFDHGTLWGKKYQSQAHHGDAATESHEAAESHDAVADDHAADLSGDVSGFVAEVSTVARAADAPRGLAESHGEDSHEIPEPSKAPIFFGIYFLMTGLHGLHVLIGMGAISWLLYRSAKGHFSSAYYTPVDLVGLYWHLVDLIWIFLFPLLYLIH
ncbi:MAG: cytochrome c oxidase subunit 3 family protein [Acidobacteriota bacterium]|nr:cytochrome c oxidase subunit 3 family protein [Acidobacteriota bacterium]MDH3784043.1 cytochrome c oxidase subunit 3 family protein [Acidobacteriota bacterium]